MLHRYFANIRHCRAGTNEQLRQLEIERTKSWLPKNAISNLFTLLLSRIKIHTRIIKVLGVLSLLVLFEYLTLLLPPYVPDFTHHTPVYEIRIFVSIAAALIPTHHHIEQWLVEKTNP